MKTRQFRIRNEGYNTLRYKPLAVERKLLYTRIYVHVNETEVMNNIPLPPDYMKHRPNVVR